MKRIIRKFFMLLTIFSQIYFGNLLGQNTIPTGTIEGKIIDADTKVPLIGTNVVLVGTVKGAATGMDGSFVIRKVPVGSYVLQFDYIGYEQLKKADVIIRSG